MYSRQEAPGPVFGVVDRASADVMFRMFPLLVRVCWHLWIPAPTNPGSDDDSVCRPAAPQGCGSPGSLKSGQSSPPSRWLGVHDARHTAHAVRNDSLRARFTRGVPATFLSGSCAPIPDTPRARPVASKVTFRATAARALRQQGERSAPDRAGTRSCARSRGRAARWASRGSREAPSRAPPSGGPRPSFARGTRA